MCVNVNYLYKDRNLICYTHCFLCMVVFHSNYCSVLRVFKLRLMFDEKYDDLIICCILYYKETLWLSHMVISRPAHNPFIHMNNDLHCIKWLTTISIRYIPTHHNSHQNAIIRAQISFVLSCYILTDPYTDTGDHVSVLSPNRAHTSTPWHILRMICLKWKMSPGHFPPITIYGFEQKLYGQNRKQWTMMWWQMVHQNDFVIPDGFETGQSNFRPTNDINM